MTLEGEKSPAPNVFLQETFIYLPDQGVYALLGGLLLASAGD